jgi:hypothetical protein
MGLGIGGASQLHYLRMGLDLVARKRIETIHHFACVLQFIFEALREHVIRCVELVGLAGFEPAISWVLGLLRLPSHAADPGFSPQAF